MPSTHPPLLLSTRGRWSVLVEKSTLSELPVRYALGDFVKAFMQVKIAARTALIHTATGKSVIPEFEEPSLQNRKWYSDWCV